MRLFVDVSDVIYGKYSAVFLCIDGGLFCIFISACFVIHLVVNMFFNY